jgi:hypothetical protein
MATTYNYDVQIEKLVKPLINYKFVAKVPYIVKNTGDKPGDKVERINPGLPECYGETQLEAHKKASEQAKKWISEQKDTQG